ncbi:eukaryotic translation initiation factor 2-alpha kinase-like [Prorops nasuta]|uniref:eukaryotic translation initiation factor 2-alpha kinase-like n=1 Tax=Prorops nasuta TaxID=863751 RepID=UPI0034CDF140
MSSSFPWSKICFYLVFVIKLLFIIVNAVEIEKLTFCDPNQSKNTQRNIIFVSTLDGKISALDAANHGKELWSLAFKEVPMLSSSIHRRELNNNGQWVRLIPSLNGKLYKFDGDNLEPIPISTDQFLHSSFRYSDDLIFSGGKETRSYGVSSLTGEVLYECSAKGCTNNTNKNDYLQQDILVIRRLQQTMRAIEPLTGLERWNYSVGQHDLTLIPRANVECDEVNSYFSPEIEIKVIIPEGLIWAVNKNNPHIKLWEKKFDSPIISIWREDESNNQNGKGYLKEIDLFDSSQWDWGSEYSVGPDLYLGMHNRQLYVQENTAFHKTLDISPPKSFQYNKYPWKPFPAVSTAVATNPSFEIDENSISVKGSEIQSTTGLSVLYNSEYINGNGYYLYSKSQLQLNGNSQCNKSQSSILIAQETDNPNISDFINSEEEEETPVQIIIVSLWYWWKEVIIISITTAVLLNFMLSQRLLYVQGPVKDAALVPLIVERHIETNKNETLNEEKKENAADFKSRYLNDFDPVDCLGKGGYGVVFEARNKIDDCNYAIKRISLPNKQDSRDRVMREVRALAKLDHHNIVRYFNAWFECPPVGWQEQYDQQWIEKLPSSVSHLEISQSGIKSSNSVHIDVTQTDEASSIDSACEAYELNKNNHEEDSFIVFEKSDCDIDIGESTENTQSFSLSMSASKDVSLSKNNDSDSSSQSIVFQNSSSNVPKSVNNADNFLKGNKSDYSESIVFQNSYKEKSKLKEVDKRRKSLFSLKLNKSYQPSPKMFLYIQMQLCQKLSLREWLKQQNTRDPQHILNIFHQIVDAVQYVHLQGLIHRDLKPSNIFFAYDDKIKIGDFGLVTAMAESYEEAHTPVNTNEKTYSKVGVHTACVGTHLYMSPEQMNCQVYNYKVDIYSLGIIFFELLTPFFTDMERVIALTNLRKSIFPEGFELSNPAEYDLLKMMLDRNPEKRPTTLGIKAKPPLKKYEAANSLNPENDDPKYHFELPQLQRNPSVTSSSSNESW